MVGRRGSRRGEGWLTIIVTENEDKDGLQTKEVEEIP